jgi:hypothetical protein
MAQQKNVFLNRFYFFAREKEKLAIIYKQGTELIRVGKLGRGGGAVLGIGPAAAEVSTL